MDEWKKVGISIIILFIIFGAGFLAGSCRANQIGDIDYQNRIAELKRINSELIAGDIQFRTDLERAEGKLQDFLRAAEDRNSRAREVLGKAQDHAGQAGSSIQRAIDAVERLSAAIEILFSDQ